MIHWCHVMSDQCSESCLGTLITAHAPGTIACQCDNIIIVVHTVAKIEYPKTKTKTIILLDRGRLGGLGIVGTRI